MNCFIHVNSICFQQIACLLSFLPLERHAKPSALTYQSYSTALATDKTKIYYVNPLPQYAAF